MLYRCDSCGYSMEYDPDKKALVCPQCGRTQKDMPAAQTSSRHGECPTCGAAFEGAENRLVYQCAYCGSWMTVEENFANPCAPKRITPFAFGKKGAREKIRGAFDQIPFLPASFLRDPDGKDIEALYAPFWMYRIDGSGIYHFEGEKQKSTKSGRTTTTYHDVFDIQRSVHAVFRQVPVDAMNSLEDDTIDAALPYDSSQSVEMDPVYLSGTNAYLPDKPMEEKEYLIRARNWTLESMDEHEKDLTKGYVGIKTKQHERSVEVDSSRSEGVLLPVYRYTYKGFGSHKIYMNGVSGRMSGDAPCDKGRVLVHYLIESVCTVVSAAAIIGIIGVLL